jgi:hypothetical protein
MFHPSAPPKKCNVRTILNRGRLRGISNRRTKRWPGVARTIRWGILVTPLRMPPIPPAPFGMAPKTVRRLDPGSRSIHIHLPKTKVEPCPAASSTLAGGANDHAKATLTASPSQAQEVTPIHGDRHARWRSRRKAWMPKCCKGISVQRRAPARVRPSPLLKTTRHRDILYTSGSNGLPTHHIPPRHHNPMSKAKPRRNPYPSRNSPSSSPP